MAKDETKTSAASDQAPAAKLPIEALCKGRERWQYAGFRARYGYGLGQLLTQAEFDTQMTAWLNGPMGQ